MSESYRRRRFLTDLLFVGGGLLAAAGLATVGQAEVGPSATPPASTPSPSSAPTSTCSPSPSTPRETGGKVVARPRPKPDGYRVMGGAVAPRVPEVPRR